MEILYIKNKKIPSMKEPLCAAIGNFDGVHLGHQKLIEEAKAHTYKSAVITFDPHPSVFLKKIKNYPLLTPMDIKKDIIKFLGVDYFIVFEVNDEMLKYSKDEFMDILEALNVKALVCGYDFTFGYKALGKVMDLKCRFTVYEIQKFLMEDIRVSSTYIREILSYGNMKEANLLLGREYSIRGIVTYGAQKGRLIGFPTANVSHEGYYLPKNGVYFVAVSYKDKEYLGMCNIGHNPTFNFVSEVRVEVHIFDFHEDIYEDTIEIHFKEHIRDEQQFKSVDELKNQLEMDKKKCLLFTQN